MKKIKTTIIASALALGGVLAGVTPASAAPANTFDCFPGVSGTQTEASCGRQDGTYRSSDEGASIGGVISWNEYLGSTLGYRVRVDPQRYNDLKADGRQPRIKIVYNGTTKVNDDGGPVYFPMAGSAGLTITVCNGGSNSAPAYCGAAHGPFHP